MPKLKFPFLTVLVTGKHTEIVLTRGVGLHTILGITIDLAIGNCLDRATHKILELKDVLKDKKQIEEFIHDYNKKYSSLGRSIPENYFDFLD